MTDNHWTKNSGLFVLRLTLAAVFFPHGAQKVLGWFGGHGLTQTVTGFIGMGMPAIVAYLVVAAEFLGPLGLLSGFLTRFSAFGILCVMSGAIVLVHWPHGFFHELVWKSAG